MVTRFIWVKYWNRPLILFSRVDGAIPPPSAVENMWPSLVDGKMLPLAITERQITSIQSHWVQFLSRGTDRLDFSQLLAVSELPGCWLLLKVVWPAVETYIDWQSSEAIDNSMRTCVFHELEAEAEVMFLEDGNMTLASSRKVRVYASKRKKDPRER
jgi:hypothetical protein